jgi:2-amino-4-hydroxy-6-hydroxymethyldihydropteridine diphosphokinase
LPERAFVGVGSNLDPKRHVLAALAALLAEETVTGVSTFFRTAPLFGVDQPPYLNGVFALAVTAEPRAVQARLLAIETRLGRVRTADRNASRVIDLDLLLQGDRVVATPDLRLPHPDVRSRAFVAVPLSELAPDLVLPDDRAPLAPLARSLAGSSTLVPAVEVTAALRRALREAPPRV